MYKFKLRKKVLSTSLKMVLGCGILFCTAAVATADTVSYYTMGRFDANSFASTDSLTVPNIAGSIKLDFAGTTQASVADGQFNVLNFGSFTSSGIFGSSFGAHTFDLEVFQTDPTAGGGTVLAGIFSGTIFSSGSQGGITFTPSIFNVTNTSTTSGGVAPPSYNTYSLVSPTVLPGTIGGTVITTAGANPSTLPIPTTATAGVSLLGVLGLVGKIRSRRKTVAI